MEPQLDTFWRFSKRFALALAIVAGLPTLIGFLLNGGHYLGIQYNFDDHMVYAAWMRQAAEGRVLFDNRFAVDTQPGLTFHAYFLILGWIAKLTGIPLAMWLARVVLTYVLVRLLAKFIAGITQSDYAAKLALSIACFGGGIGFLVWHNFGIVMTRPTAQPIAELMRSRLPVDVWQPEIFVFPSVLTNSLFVVSLCLMLVFLSALLQSQHSWKPVIPGALAMLALMNIHSYDVLLLTLAAVAFVGTAIASRTFTWAWTGRAAIMGAGAIPSALWFLHVLANDTVFQARAATPTYAPDFRALFAGVLPVWICAVIGMGRGQAMSLARWIGLGIVTLGPLLLFGLSTPTGGDQGYWMGMVAWVTVFGCSVVAATLLATDRLGWNLVVSWALVGMVAPYFPALFQRKLAMGWMIPLGILAALGIEAMVQHRDQLKRNMATLVLILLMGGSSVRWLAREQLLFRTNVSNTTVHPVRYNDDVVRIVRALKGRHERLVVLAPPGIPAAIEGEVDSFGQPAMPDLNPLLSGLTGAYTYAGHWSETPDYGRRRNLITQVFLGPASLDERRALIEEAGADYLVAPTPEAYPGVADLRSLGEIEVSGPTFELIRLRRP
ncbi:MAG: hypothetical protein JNM85_08920 [Chthonomonas sp.]|nr:hypothetical protein [Chthonomonas sp.]